MFSCDIQRCARFVCSCIVLGISTPQIYKFFNTCFQKNIILQRYVAHWPCYHIQLIVYVFLFFLPRRVYGSKSVCSTGLNWPNLVCPERWHRPLCPVKINEPALVINPSAIMQKGPGSFDLRALFIVTALIWGPTPAVRFSCVQRMNRAVEIFSYFTRNSLYVYQKRRGLQLRSKTLFHILWSLWLFH